MGYAKDITNVTRDLKKWYKQINSIYHKSGMSNKMRNLKGKVSNRKNNTGEKARKKYQDLCKWLRKEMKK